MAIILLTIINSGGQNIIDMRGKKISGITFPDGVIITNGHYDIPDTFGFKNGKLHGYFVKHDYERKIEGVFYNNKLTTAKEYYMDTVNSIPIFNLRMVIDNNIFYTWNEINDDSTRTLINGDGILSDGVVAEYKNGLKNGTEVFTYDEKYTNREDSETKRIKYYTDDVLTKTDYHYKNGAVKTMEFTEPQEILYDTLSYPVWVGDSVLWPVMVRKKSIPIKVHCTYKLKNGVIAYEGYLENGGYIGKWEYHYPNGIKQLEINYKNNSFTQYDSLGHKVKGKKQYISLFVSGRFCYDRQNRYNHGFDRDTVTISAKYPHNHIEFHPDGTIEAYAMPYSCKAFFEPVYDTGKYYLINDMLYITFYKMDYIFKIVELDKDTMLLIRQKE